MDLKFQTTEPFELLFEEQASLGGGGCIYFCAAFFPRFFSVFKIYRKECYRDRP